MIPGARARPSAFTVSLAVPSLGPIAAILPSVTPKSPCVGLAPEPSKISASLITRSNMAVSSVWPDVSLWRAKGNEGTHGGTEAARVHGGSGPGGRATACVGRDLSRQAGASRHPLSAGRRHRHYRPPGGAEAGRALEANGDRRQQGRRQ